jgi:multidrug efflux pump subunit AcrA (membrane-fusion protein)
MKRRAGRQNIQVALFPFLAVLICTLGSLIVLLVLFTAQAKVEARSHVAADASPGPDPEETRRAQEAYDDAQWRRELLESQRAERQTELASARDKLSHLEDHLSTLQARARELIERAQAIDAGDELQSDEQAAAQQELARLKAEIERKQREIAEARQKQAAAEKWFALIPYDGPNGTRRRPIYIECRAEGIVLQPEGIVFRPEDFNGPMGPGNPLDRALRTVREHLRATGSQAGEPYPLLVVRPSGVVAYGAARSALRGWDDEFGYELIDDNKRLDYGEADPHLAQELQRTVAEARQRQASLIAKMPRKFEGEEPLTTFDPAAVPGLNTQAFGSSGIGASSGRGIGGGSGGTGSGSGGTGGGGSLSSTGGPQLGSPTGESSLSSSGSGFPGFSGGPASGGLPPGEFSGTGGSGATATGPYAASGAPGGGSQGGNSQSGRTQGGQAGGTGSSSGGSAGSSGGTGGSNPGSMGGPSLGGSTSGSAGSTSGDAASGRGSSRRGSSGSGSTSQGSASSGSAVASGRGRGSNWGLSGATNRSTGITRPLQVVVLLDRLVLVPERGDSRPAQQLRISPQMSQAELDRFVETVQLEMKSWGLAVEGGYWKPILQIEVAPDAERHYADLVRGLEGSGFEIERKRP